MLQSTHERYKFAEQLYCYTGKSIAEIAEITKIPVRSLYRRAREHKWESLRRASLRSPAILAEEMYRELSDLTAAINARPEGQRIPTPTEAELRRKIVYSIAAVKKFPTHAEAAWVLQSLLRYNSTFHDNAVEGLDYLVEGFLAHRDVYGFASFQPEHNQDLNQPAAQDLEALIDGDVEPRTTPFDDPADDIRNSEGYKQLEEYKLLRSGDMEAITQKFKTGGHEVDYGDAVQLRVE